MAGLIERMLAPALGVALLAAILVSLWQWSEAVDARSDAVRVQGEFNSYKAQQERQTAEALRQLRDDEIAGRSALLEALNEESARRVAAEAARRRSDAAAGGLRDELAATRASLAAVDTRSPEGCEAARETASVCTGLLQQCSGRRRELAVFAEAAAGAGQVCERAYRALTPEAK